CGHWTWWSLRTLRRRTWPGRWVCRPGWYCARHRTGAGCWIGKIARGIRPCGWCGSGRKGIGGRCLSGWRTRCGSSSAAGRRTGVWPWACPKLPGQPLQSAAPSVVVELGDSGGRHRHELALRLAQKWIPDIENQNDALFVAIVPRLVLDGIVEDEGCANRPVTRLGANAEAAVRRDHQRNVHGEADVGGAGVGWDVGLRLEQRKERGGAPVRDFDDVRLCQRRDGLGAAGDVLLLGLAVLI